MAAEARGLLLAGIFACATPAMAVAQGAPLSAIDWLSDTVARPVAPPPTEPPARPPGAPEPITTTLLRARNLDGIGLLAPQVTGIDRRFWAGSQTVVLNGLIASDHPEPLPALRDLFHMLMLAELEAPQDADGSGSFLLARVDKLLELGALEAAAALVAEAGQPTPGLFRRAFDIALLLGTEDSACAELRRAPGIAPTIPARIFCLARGGDWQAAELTLSTAQALGEVSAEEEAMLTRFLDPEGADEAEPLPPPERITPLVLRILEAIGEPVSATGLPLAFAHGDLTPANGWKARLEAGERLARAGAITPAQLFALYIERRPAASGGVWARAAAVQQFETALASGEHAVIAEQLPLVWAALAGMELEVPLAEVHAATVSALRLPGEAGALAFRLALLGPNYERAAMSRRPLDGMESFLIGIARGHLGAQPPPDGLARAIAPVFAAGAVAPAISAPMQELLSNGRHGEAALIAIDKVTRGSMGDLRGVTEGLALLRRLGLESPARKAALQLMLLERRG